MIRVTNLKDSYSFYVQECENREIVPISIYLKIVYGFIKFIVKKVIDGWDVQLSGGQSLGALGIRGEKTVPKLNEYGEIRNLSPDWGNTRKLWRNDPEAKINRTIIYHTNDHTNGIRYRWVWWKAGMKIANKYDYSLIFTKGPNGNKRLVAKAIKNGKEYIVNAPKQHNNGQQQ